MSTWTVTYSGEFIEQAQSDFPVERHPDGGMRFGQFMAGPVRAARLLLRANWDEQPMEAGGSVRTAWVLDPTLGPVVFYAVLVGERVEIAGYDIEPGYWTSMDVDPHD